MSQKKDEGTREWGWTSLLTALLKGDDPRHTPDVYDAAAPGHERKEGAGRSHHAQHIDVQHGLVVCHLRNVPTLRVGVWSLRHSCECGGIVGVCARTVTSVIHPGRAIPALFTRPTNCRPGRPSMTPLTLESAAAT